MPRAGLTHAYPEELAAFVVARLDEMGAVPVGLTLPRDLTVIEAVLSVAYQASMLRDEDRPLSFRLTIAPHEAFDAALGPPHGAHNLRFSEPRQLSVHQLKKLAPAVKFERSIVAVFPDQERLAIWGLLHTGPRWLRFARGGRGGVADATRALIVHVNGPGDLVVSLGQETLARLYAGELTIPMVDVFESRWLPALFAPVRSELAALHAEDRERSGHRWADVDIEVIRRSRKTAACASCATKMASSIGSRSRRQHSAADRVARGAPTSGRATCRFPRASKQPRLHGKCGKLHDSKRTEKRLNDFSWQARQRGLEGPSSQRNRARGAAGNSLPTESEARPGRKKSG